MLDSQPIYDYIPKDCYADFERYVTDAWDQEENKVKLKSNMGLSLP